MKISFVVIAYNEAHNLERCLLSVTEQDGLAEYEVVIVNDGSSDATRLVAEQFISRFPQAMLINHERNLGRGAARHTGALAARGDMLAYIDGDNLIPPNWLSICLEYMNDFDAVGGLAIPDGDATYIYSRLSLRPRLVPPSTVVTGANGLYRRRVFDSVTFDLSLRGGEDVAMNHAMELAGFRTKLIPGLITEHIENKTYAKSISWLYESGRGASRQLRRYKKIRRPDIAFFVFFITMLISLLEFARKGNLTSLIWPFVVLGGTSTVHVLQKFHIHLKDVPGAICAVAIDCSLLAAYYIGRLANWRGRGA